MRSWGREPENVAEALAFYAARMREDAPTEFLADYMVVHGSVLAESFLNAFYGLEAWDDQYLPDYLDSFLICPKKKPLDRLVYSGRYPVPQPSQAQVALQGDFMWYCAHAIFYFKYEGQQSCRLHENVYLIQSRTAESAWQRAESLAWEQEVVGEDGHLEVDGNKATYHFAGIRKLIEAQVDSGK